MQVWYGAEVLVIEEDYYEMSIQQAIRYLIAC